MKIIFNYFKQEQTKAYLNGARGLAVIMVLAHHSIFITSAPFNSTQLKSILDSGYVGVSLFFIISAFTMTLSWRNREKNENNLTRNFYLRRFFRIIPFWWVNVFYWSVKNPTDFSVLITNLFLGFSFFSYYPGFTMVPYSWSLAVEEIFYLSFPFLIHKCNKWRFLIMALILSILVSALWDATANTFFSGSKNHEFVFAFPISRFYIFFLGFALYKLHTDEILNLILSGLKKWVFLFIEILLIISFLYLYKMNHIESALAMMFFLFFAGQKNGLINKLLSGRFIGQVGICCYSMYFIHFHVLNYIYENKFLVTSIGATSQTGESEFVFIFILAFFVTFFLSTLSFYLFEKPFVKLGALIISATSQKRVP